MLRIALTLQRLIDVCEPIAHLHDPLYAAIEDAQDALQAVEDGVVPVAEMLRARWREVVLPSEVLAGQARSDVMTLVRFILGEEDENLSPFL